MIVFTYVGTCGIPTLAVFLKHQNQFRVGLSQTVSRMLVLAYKGDRSLKYSVITTGLDFFCWLLYITRALIYPVYKRPDITFTELYLIYLEIGLQYLVSQERVRKNMAICHVFYALTYTYLDCLL